MLRLAVCVSGGGTNLQALIDAIEAGVINNVRIVRVISSRHDAAALERAAKAGIETRVVFRGDYSGKDSFEEALKEALDEAEPDLIVLAGYLTVIPASVVDAYRNRIINIHPALIPSFCGKGCYGLKVHEEALKRGVKVTGATVHFVDEGCDSGPIIMQKAVAVQDDDTPETLQKRVMEEAEWVILPKTVGLIAENRVEVHGDRVRILS
ncbi:MAG: phosphoribosylglycinamide formyltransferase [Lachnospiraceae bacterium]|nr:phosphoribosylglycinamide formyltransferase [Lachnospiraceae bacterium]